MAAVACAVYAPTDLDTRHFWEQESNRTVRHLEIPVGLPKKLDSPLAWKGEDVAKKESQWTLHLTRDEVQAIDAAMSSFEAKYDDLSALSPTTFPLPADFSQRLRDISDHLYKKTGFFLIRGLDPERYTPKQKLIVYTGVTQHVCPKRGFVDVFASGVVAHVINVQAGGKGPSTVSPAYSGVPLSFHTDNCEIMAFYYLDTALSGGETILSSIWQTYNELAEKRPDVLHTLADPWILESFKPHEIQRPRHVRLLQKLEDCAAPILLRFSRYPITGFQRKRSPTVPDPTAAQLDAANAIQFTAAKNRIRLPASKGDLLLVNDMAVFHGREAFDDGGIIGKRHLVKMYFRDPEQGWGLPEEMEKDWMICYGPNQPDGTRKETWAVEPFPGMEELSKLNG